MSKATQRWRGVIAYDGTGLYGWQKQPGGNTVQDFLEARLQAVFKKPVCTVGSGRTDSGVHARGLVFHFDAAWPHPQEHLLRALRVGFPAGISLRSIRRASPDFHARYSAVGKRYVYRIYEGYALPFEARYCLSIENRRLAIERMQAAAQLLVGQHDFTAYAAERGDGSEENPVKDLRRLDVVKRGPRISITAEADGFLYKMVRSLAGTLMEVGCGKLEPAEVAEILHNRQRTNQVVTAPAQGLTLEKVFY